MTATIRGISSMATRQLLGQLAAAYEASSGVKAAIESVGGVDAAKRVRDGEAFDVVILAADAIEQLAALGRVVQGSRVDLVRSGVSVAVRAGAALPDISSEDALQGAVLAARSIGYSTGPSGTEVIKLFQRWGVAGELAGRLKQASPGVPVGGMVASGDVELGFQQLSELIHVPGITVVGSMPQPVQIVTTFSGGVVTGSPHGDAARSMLRFMASPAAAEAKRRQGMEPA